MYKKMIVLSKKILLKDKLEYIITPGFIEIIGIQITKVKKLSIESYQECIEKEKLSENSEIHDFGDLLISPSFVNCHTHIAMSFFRAILNNRTLTSNLVEDLFFKAESQLSANDVKAFARIGAYENILNGNALIWDHYYYGYEVAEACIDTGISAVIAPTLQDICGPGVSQYKKALDDTFAIDEEKKFHSSAIFSSFGPHATDTVSENLWQYILTHSLSRGLPIHCHVAQSYEEVKRIYYQHKLTPISFLDKIGVLQSGVNSLLVHGIYLNKACLKKLHPENNALVFCPFSQMIFQFPANILEWEKHKVQWFVATDSVASNDSMNLQKEIRYINGFPTLLNTFGNYKKVLNKNINTEKRQFLNTRKTIKILQEKFTNTNFLLDKVLAGPGSFHPKFKAGLIEKNTLANLTVWDTNHPSFWPPFHIQRSLSMGDTTGAIHNMCIKGKWIAKNGYFSQSILNSDLYKEAIREANERLKYLLKKL